MFGAHIIATDRITKENDPVEVTGPMMATIMILGAVMLVLLPIRSEGISILADFQELLLTLDFFIPLFLCAARFLSGATGSEYIPKGFASNKGTIIYAFEPVWAGIASLVMGYDEIGFWFFLGAGALLIGNLVVEFEGLNAKAEEE